MSRTVLMEVLHPDFTGALHDNGEVVIAAQPINPRLHATMHQMWALT